LIRRQPVYTLPTGWLNDWGGLFAWTLPDDWKKRRTLIAQFGRLKVYAAGRLDLITMKFIAHREADLEHLKLLNVTADDKAFVRSCLDTLDSRYPADRHPDYAGRIAMAKEYLHSW
jgi:hypothetical protein